MHILILGSSGFLGSHITSHLLQQGHTVRAAVRGTAAGRPPQKGLAHAVWDGVDDMSDLLRRMEEQGQSGAATDPDAPDPDLPDPDA